MLLDLGDRIQQHTDHDQYGGAAELLLKAGASVAVVQRIEEIHDAAQARA